ncbi:MAG: DUF993 family protein [Planctomycetota bacterium]
MTRATAPLGATSVVIDGDALATFRARVAPNTKPVRVAFAAAHVAFHGSYAAVEHSSAHPGTAAEIAEHVDWETTLHLRQRIAAHGFGIAEAMDTAQRFDVGWQVAARLIEETGRLKLPGGFVAGAGVDHLAVVRDRRDLVDGVVHQVEFIQAAGGIPIILPMPWLTAHSASADDYVEVYGAIIRQCRAPLLVHWLGEMFHPGLRGYFPGDSFERVMDLDPNIVRGCKLSLLDAAHERATRARLLPRGQVVMTGDDFNFAELIAGAGPPTGWSELQGQPLALGPFSHALLGVFDAVAAPAGVALSLLAAGDRNGYDTLMAPCEALGRHLFEAPTQHYKAGVAFLAWLDGAQPNPMLANHAERARSKDHYRRALELAAAARVFSDAATVAERAAAFFAD